MNSTNCFDNNKWFNLFENYLFWIRIFALILSTVLLLLSVSFCIGQLIEAKLDIITQCQPKTREEIWEHSYQSSLDQNGEVIMNEESQFGLTDDACWTTKKVEINTDQLWFINKYIHHWKTNINAQCIFYGLISVYLVIIIFYNLITLIMDIVVIAKYKLHTKSSLYERHIRSLQKTNSSITNTPNNKKEVRRTLSRKCNKFKKMYLQFYFKYFVNDTTGWIILKFMSECTEIMVQSQALLLYNGHYLFDPHINKDSAYLANKPDFIVAFSVILSVNCFGSGFLWLLYAVIPRYCHGILFKRAIFFVDKFSDFLYILFPFYMIIGSFF